MECEDDYLEDIATIMLCEEMLPYDLIDYLLRARGRLERMVMDLRGEVNDICRDSGFQSEPPYPMTAENVCDRISEGFPAMNRYKELYGDYAYDDESDESLLFECDYF